MAWKQRGWAKGMKQKRTRGEEKDVDCMKWVFFFVVERSYDEDCSQVEGLSLREGSRAERGRGNRQAVLEAKRKRRGQGWQMKKISKLLKKKMTGSQRMK
jgi:hypothetical protein